MNASISFDESFAYVLHSGGMTGKRKLDKERGKRVRYIRKEILALKAQEDLASLVAAETGDPLSRGAVGNWEQGKEIGFKNIRALAKIANVPLEWISDNIGDPFTPQPTADDEVVERTTPVVGYVGAGATAHFYAVSQGELDQVPPPPDASKSTVAVEVKGDSIGPLFNQWLVFYDDVRSPVTPDLIGRLCVVGLMDDRVVVKKIRKTKIEGLYNLISNDERENINDVEIIWAARVKHMAPR